MMRAQQQHQKCFKKIEKYPILMKFESFKYIDLLFSGYCDVSVLEFDMM